MKPSLDAAPAPTAQGGAPGPAAPDPSLAGPELAPILERALAGHELSVEEGTRLFEASGAELAPLLAAADYLRRQAVGDQVTYVVNRNINFTNVCVKRCGFCAFSRGHRATEGYFLPHEEVLRRAREAVELGATEVCMQAGLAPGLDGWFYVDLVRAVKRELPALHIHGCSPEEVLYGSQLADVTVEHYLRALQDAGLGSLPGTSAEILDDSVRDVISPGRITTAQWSDLIRTAHRLGIPTTSTMMYGHLETARHKAAHLVLLRSIQQETGGFTEFVPLGFVFDEAPMFAKRRPPGLREGPSGIETLKMYAVSRILLHGWIPNVQVSWVKEGQKLAQVGLMAGANDLGGTLINESISTAAGARHGQLVTPRTFRRLAREMGRQPAERSTDYRILRTFADPAADPEEPLEQVTDPQGRFGSYHDLIAEQRFRFKDFMAGHPGSEPAGPGTAPGACGD
jgi:7,8-didemethyl-8-hydroxy-5-deazariboflavin synthase CofH subunit